MDNPFCIFARAEIRAFLDARGHTLRWLSIKTGVAYHKLYRIEHKEVKKGLSFADAADLVEFICKDRADDILRKYYPAEASRMKLIAESQRGLQNSLLAFALDNSFRWEVHLFLKNGRPKISLDISERYSTRGLETADDLVDEGVFVVEEGVYKCCLDAELNSSDRTLRLESHKHIDTLDIGAPGGYLRNNQVAFNLEGRKAAYDATVNFAALLDRIANDPSYQGDQLTLLTVGIGPMLGVEKV